MKTLNFSSEKLLSVDYIWTVLLRWGGTLLHRVELLVAAAARVRGLAAIVAKHPAVAALSPFASYDSFGRYAAQIPSKPAGTPETSASALVGARAVADALVSIVEGGEDLALASEAATRYAAKFQCTGDLVASSALAALGGTSVHEAWTSAALVLACSAYAWTDGGRDAAALALTTWASESLAPLSRAGGRNRSAYVNEAQTTGFDVPWASLFWGDRYPRLLAAKRALDPAGLWHCPNCVGSEL